jgi:hypothetical protein
MTRAQTTWLASALLALTFGGTAAAQSPEQPQKQDEEEKPANQQDNSNQAGPVEDGRGLTPTGNVIDGTGDDQNNPADTTAPTHEQVNSDTNDTTTVVVPNTQPQTYNSTTVVTPPDDDYGERERAGIAITAGAGASGFTNSNLRGETEFGGDWGVRLTFGTRSPLAFEASYIGSAQRIEALGLDDNAYLVSNGAQGALRFNITADLPVQPFLFAGLAWRRYDLANTATNLSDVDDVDNVVELPLGAGIAGKAAGLIIDVRGEFRPAFDEDLLPQAIEGTTLEPGDAVPMHRWGVNANLGYEF